MPSWVLDEDKWEKAKKVAKKQGRSGDYDYITGIYKQMKGRIKKKVIKAQDNGMYRLQLPQEVSNLKKILSKTMPQKKESLTKAQSKTIDQKISEVDRLKHLLKAKNNEIEKLQSLLKAKPNESVKENNQSQSKFKGNDHKSSSKPLHKAKDDNSWHRYLLKADEGLFHY